MEVMRISPASQVKEIANRIVKYLEDNFQDRFSDEPFWAKLWWEKLFLLREHAWWHYKVYSKALVSKGDIEGANYLPGEEMLASINNVGICAEGTPTE